MNDFKKLAGQTVIYGLGTMVPRLLNYLLLTPYFLYSLFSEAHQEYGKVTELYAYITFLMILLTLGMETTYFRFMSGNKDKVKVYNTILTTLLFVSALFLILILVFTPQVAHLLKYDGEPIFIQLLAGILAVEAFSAIPFARLRIENRAMRFAVLKFIHVILNISLMLGIYNFGPKVLGYSTYLLNEEGIISARFIFLANFLSSSVILLLLIPELRNFRIQHFSFKYLFPILVYGLPLMISGLAGTINETLDRSIYKHIISDQNVALYELGIYGANYKLGGLILIFVQMFRYAAEPYFFSKSRDIDAKEQYALLMNIFVGLILALSLFILLFLNYLKFFISPSYHEGLFVVPYIVMAYILYGVLFYQSIWYKLSNRTNYALIIMLIGALFTVVINVYFVPQYRYGASAIAHVISYGMMVLVSYFLGQKYYPVPYNLSRIALYMIVAFSIYVINRLITVDKLLFDLLIKSVLLLLFLTFVSWKEGLLKMFFIHDRKNR